VSSAAVVAHLRVATPTALGKEKQTVTLLHGSNKSHSILKKKKSHSSTAQPVTSSPLTTTLHQELHPLPLRSRHKS